MQVNGNGGIIRDMDDGATDGSTTLIATCNALGTAWINSGVEVNSVECSIGKNNFMLNKKIYSRIIRFTYNVVIYQSTIFDV